MLVESPGAFGATGYVVAGEVEQGATEEERQCTAAGLNPLAMKLLQRIWDFGGEVVNIQRDKTGAWTIGFYPDSVATGQYADLLIMPLGRYYSLTLKRSGYLFRTEDEMDQIIPSTREAFHIRFRLPEREFCNTLPTHLAPNSARKSADSSKIGR